MKPDRRKNYQGMKRKYLEKNDLRNVLEKKSVKFIKPSSSPIHHKKPKTKLRNTKFLASSSYSLRSKFKKEKISSKQTVGALPQKRTTQTISNNLLSDFQDSKGQSILLNKLKNASVSNPFLVGGLDLSFFPKCDKKAVCGYTIFAYHGPEKGQKLVFESSNLCQIKVPYKAGFLGYREAQPMIESVRLQIQSQPQLKPDVLLVDGHGILHPERFGSACHVGHGLKMSTIGVAKKMFYFGHFLENSVKRDIKNSCDKMELAGQLKILKSDDTKKETLGCILQTSKLLKSQPVFVSQGK